MHNDWYTASVEPEIVTFEEIRGLGITGKGAPGGPAHLEAIGALYAVAGPLLGAALPPLEGFWWTEPPGVDPFRIPRDEWHWQLFLRLTDDVTATPTAPVELVTVPASQCVQVMHVGSYDNEPATLARMNALMDKHDLVANGRHHEIYLTDFQTTPPDELRTILRQPVRPGR